MYQTIGAIRTATYFSYLVLFIFIISHLKGLPTDAQGWWKAGAAAIGLASTVVLVLGQTPLFPQICKLPLVRDMFPPIDGKWHAVLTSNWPAIAQLHGLPAPASSTTTASVKVVARLFFVRIDLLSTDRYSNSKTVAVSVRKDPQTGAVRLHYVYENATPTPVATDTGHHHGAAYLDVEGNGKQMRLEGLYWTNRNWTQAKNTAGSIVWTKP